MPPRKRGPRPTTQAPQQGGFIWVYFEDQSGYMTPEIRREFANAMLHKAAAAARLASPDGRGLGGDNDGYLWLADQHPQRANLIMATVGKGPLG